MTFLRNCRHFWQKRVNKECERACGAFIFFIFLFLFAFLISQPERVILERLLYSEADYDVRAFAEAGLAELLAKNVHYTVSIINSLPSLVRQVEGECLCGRNDL